MKYLLIALLLAGCSESEPAKKYTGPTYQDNINAGIQACLKQNGVPIISSWDGRLVDCKFKRKRSSNIFP